MSPVGGAIFGAALPTLAFGIWAGGTLLLQAEFGEWAPAVVGEGLLGLWAAQSFALALWVPVCVARHGVVEAAGSALLLAVFAAPGLAVLWLLGACTLALLLEMVLWLVATGLGLVGLGWLVIRAAGKRSGIGIVRGVALVLVFAGLVRQLLKVAQ